MTRGKASRSDVQPRRGGRNRKQSRKGAAAAEAVKEAPVPAEAVAKGPVSRSEGTSTPTLPSSTARFSRAFHLPLNAAATGGSTAERPKPADESSVEKGKTRAVPPRVVPDGETARGSVFDEQDFPFATGFNVANSMSRGASQDSRGAAASLTKLASAAAVAARDEAEELFSGPSKSALVPGTTARLSDEPGSSTLNIADVHRAQGEPGRVSSGGVAGKETPGKKFNLQSSAKISENSVANGRQVEAGIDGGKCGPNDGNLHTAKRSHDVDIQCWETGVEHSRTTTEEAPTVGRRQSMSEEQHQADEDCVEDAFRPVDVPHRRASGEEKRTDKNQASNIQARDEIPAGSAEISSGKASWPGKEITPRTSRRIINNLKAQKVADEVERKGLSRALTQVSATLEDREREVAYLRASNQGLNSENTRLKTMISSTAGGVQVVEGGKRRKVSTKAGLGAALDDLRSKISDGLRHAETFKATGVKLELLGWVSGIFMKEQVALIVLDLAEREDGVLCQVWYPPLWEIRKGKGEGTVKMSQTSNEDTVDLWADGNTYSHTGTVQMVPRNPTILSERGATEGGLYGNAILADNGGVCDAGISKLLEEWMVAHLERKRDSSVLDKEERLSICKGLAQESALMSILRDKLTRRASEMKRTFVRRFMKSCLPSYGRELSTAGDADASARVMNTRTDGSEAPTSIFPDPVAFLMGGGAFSAALMPDECFSSWSESRRSEKYLFGSWRRLTSEEIQDTLVKRAPNLKMTVEDDEWGSRDTPRTFVDDSGVPCGDKLFRNAHACRAMATFMGRFLADGRIDGDTSILSVARADAWIATHFSLSPVYCSQDVASGDHGRPPKRNLSAGGGGLRNARHNELYSTLLPHALISLLQELRDAMVSVVGDDASDLELSKPFSVEEASSLRKSLAPSSSEEMENYISAVDEISPVPYSSHQGNEFSSGFRKATVSFRHLFSRNDEDDGSSLRADHGNEPPATSVDYLLLRPEFVRESISPWIGDVLDAYIGQCGPKDMKYSPIALADFHAGDQLDLT